MEEPLVKCKVWKVQQNFNMFIKLKIQSEFQQAAKFNDEWSCPLSIIMFYFGGML